MLNQQIVAAGERTSPIPHNRWLPLTQPDVPLSLTYGWPLTLIARKTSERASILYTIYLLYPLLPSFRFQVAPFEHMAASC